MKKIEKIREYNRKYYQEHEKEFKEYYLKNKEKISKSNKKYYEKNRKYYMEYHKIYNPKYYKKNKNTIKIYGKRYYQKNIDKFKEYRLKNKEYLKKYYGENKEKIKKKARNYYQNNKKQIRKKRNKYQKKRYKTDKNFIIQRRLRYSLNQALKLYTKTGKIMPSDKYGVDYKKIIKHYEKKGIPKNLSNYENHHIKPLHTFNFVLKDGTTNLKEVKKAWKPKNLILITKEEHKEIHKKLK